MKKDCDEDNRKNVRVMRMYIWVRKCEDWKWVYRFKRS